MVPEAPRTNAGFLQARSNTLTTSSKGGYRPDATSARSDPGPQASTPKAANDTEPDVSTPLNDPITCSKPVAGRASQSRAPETGLAGG